MAGNVRPNGISPFLCQLEYFVRALANQILVSKC
jgi:hypothetical protein